MLRKAVLLSTLLITAADCSSQHVVERADPDSLAHVLLSKMTLRQKLHEMHGRGVVKFGLSILISRKVRPVKAGGDHKLGIPPTIFLDGPRGVSLRKGTTAFPVTMARGASWDPELEHRVGVAMASEILALGANYSGAVCMNLLRHPGWGRAQETYGEDPHHVGEMALALTNGIQSLGVQACAKHFAVNSMENNRFGGDFIVSDEVLHEVYLPHFRKVVNGGVASLMSAYNRLNGEYCGHSRELLTEILRHDWGFKGYVTSDWQHGLLDAHSGISAGMNVEMPSGRHYSYKNIKRLIRSGEITEDDIDALVFPTLRTKLLFEQVRNGRTVPCSVVGGAAHRALAREVAEKSAVLLKNEQAVLPLDTVHVRKLAVLGSLAASVETGDHGSSQVFATDVVSPIAGIRAYLQGSHTAVLTTLGQDSIQERSVASICDAVVVVAGMTWHDEGEYIGRGTIRDSLDREPLNPIVKVGVLGRGGDRRHLNLHPNDIRTIRTAASVNDRVIVVLVAGSAVTVEEWRGDVEGVLQTFYNGVEGGNALARILFGDVNPSGKLPFSVPKNETDLPPFHPFSSSVEYGRFHGYTLFDNKGIEPRYPFGYGLSYTTFSVSAPEMSQHTLSESDSLHVTVQVRNTGDRPGAEVVQVYVGFPDHGDDTPVKLLKAFRKVLLNPKESKAVTLTVPVSDLARYDAVSRTWAVRQGDYRLLVGNSSDNASLHELSFSVRD